MAQKDAKQIESVEHVPSGEHDEWTGPLPALSWTELRRAAKTIPPSAAIVPEIMKTMIRIRATLMPARRAASGLPPTA